MLDWIVGDGEESLEAWLGTCGFHDTSAGSNVYG